MEREPEDVVTNPAHLQRQIKGGTEGRPDGASGNGAAADRCEEGRLEMTAAVRAPRSSCLPLGMAPRGLSRMQAAEYVGVSAIKFDEWAKDRKIAFRIGKRVLYDRYRIDAELNDMMDSEVESPDRWKARGFQA